MPIPTEHHQIQHPDTENCANLYCNASSLEVKWVTSQHILQSQQAHVGSECHLAHTVSVEVKLVLNNLREVL